MNLGMNPHRDSSERLLDWARQAPPELLPEHFISTAAILWLARPAPSLGLEPVNRSGAF